VIQLQTSTCPVCGLGLSEPPTRRDQPNRDLAYYSCPHCGHFGLTRTALVNLRALDLSNDPTGKLAPTFAYTLRRMQMTQEWPLVASVDSVVAERIIQTATLPSVQERQPRPIPG